MTDPHKTSPNDTQIQHRRDRLMMLPFAGDPRASLPRPLRPTLPANASLAGVPLGLRARVGKGVQTTAFPYTQFLQRSGDLAYADLDMIELENSSWRVTLCPSLGGRILEVFDRRRQRELLLQPAVLNQGIIGLAGAWFIGGLEFNAFRYGHNVHGSSAIECRRVKLPDGTPAVELGAFDELYGCSWRACIALGARQVFLRIELSNHSAEPQPDYWWTTMAVPADRHTRVMAAPGPMLHHGMSRIGYQHDRWPMLFGRDWSCWPNHHEIIAAYLHENSSDFFGYVAGASGVAFVHQADHTVCRGRKLWSIGAGRDDAIWSDRGLLEKAPSSYLELQSGLNPMQVECGQLQPGERRAWTESLGAIDLDFGDEASRGDYGALFARYERAAAAEMRAEFVGRNAPEAWAIAQGEVLTAAAPRVDLSRRITLEPQRVTVDEVTSAVEQGWVAGSDWRRKLEGLFARDELSVPGQLALAAAMIDAGQLDDGLRRLRALAETSDATAGWAAYLLGLQSADQRWLERATERLPDRAETWLALDNVLAQQQRHLDRRQLWARAPRSLGARDDVRVALAAGAFARGEWGQVRALLQAPLPSISEGSMTPWLLCRESYVAEALSLWTGGNDDEPSRLFYLGAQSMPQFGIGRDEAGWAQDILYYRWRLAREKRRSVEAALLLGMGMLQEAYAGSISAAYLARLASEAGHPSAKARVDALEEWDDQSGEGARAFTALRAAVVERLTSGKLAGWIRLQGDPLYLHRAAFELRLSS
jgi:hypothetical protein